LAIRKAGNPAFPCDILQEDFKMRKITVYGCITIMAALAVMTTLAACATKPAAQTAGAAIPPAPENPSHLSVKVKKTVILDYMNSNVPGMESFPGWLRVLVVNNRASVVKQEFTLPDDTVIRRSQAERANLEEARVLSDLNFAQEIAYELKRYVVSASARNLDQGSMDIVEEVTSSTKVTLTGAQKLQDFWQLVEKEEDGVKSRSYVWYTVYAFPGNTWGALTRKYVNDVIGQIPDRRVQQQIARDFGEIDRLAQRNEERSDAEFKQQLDLQRKAAEDKQKQTMAQIAQQGARDQAAANVAEAQAVAEAEARYAAYKYGDPATAAAASVTAGDIDWISALGTAADIVL
jgi:hypothetical protein